MLKDTNDLRNELEQTADLSRFLKDNRNNFCNDDLPTMLEQALKKSGLGKSELARRSELSEPYLHQIFSGRRTPSRDRLLCLCFGLGADVDETQRMLKQCGHARLYAGNRRDAIILFGLLHGQTAMQVNDRLYQENEKTIF